MHKIILLFFLLSAQLVHAQNKTNGLEIGISAGTSLSSLVKAQSPFSTINTRPGIQAGIMAGVTARYTFTQHVAIKTALYYEEKGAKVEERILTENEQVRDEQIFVREVNNNYLTVPLLLSWQSTGRLSLYGQGGGFVSLLISSRVYGMDSRSLLVHNTPPGSLPSVPGGTISKSEFDIDGKPRTHTVDYGYAMGGGVYYTINDKVKLSINSLLNISLRKLDSQYDNDLIRKPGTTGFIEDKKDYFQLSSRARNINLLVNMGLSFKVR